MSLKKLILFVYTVLILILSECIHLYHPNTIGEMLLGSVNSLNKEGK